MSDNSGVKIGGGGIGFSGLLAVLFIGLKLTGCIDWSWLWVLAPIWIPLALVVGIILAVIVAIVIVAAVKSKK